MKKLIVYFSRAGENYNVGELTVGNTEVIANYIKDATGADMFKIEPVKAYPHDYNECILITKDELDRDARPIIKSYLDSLDEYDTIYLGYPIWWGKMPMCVYAFLEHYSFAGKTIKPFCTHEGNGLGNTVIDLKKKLHGADVKDGLEVQGSTVKDARSKVEEWVNK